MFPTITCFKQRLDPHLGELVMGASVALALKLAAGAIAFGFQVALARALGAMGMGIFVLVLTILTIATALSRFGLDNVLLRGTAVGAAAQDWPSVHGLYQRAMRLAFTTSGFVSLILWLLAPWLAESVFQKPELTHPLQWIVLAVVPTTLLILHSELLKGLKRIVPALSVQSLLIPLLGLIGLWLMPVDKLDVTTVIWVYTLAALLTALVGYWQWSRHAQHEAAPASRPTVRKLLASCMPLLGATFLGGIIIPWAPVLFLGAWVSSSEVGIFGVATRLATLTGLILIAVNSIAAPKFAALYQKGDFKNLGDSARHSTLMMTVIATPILLFFIVVPEWVLHLFGEDFVGGGLVLAILAIGQFINVATGSVGYLLTMSGHERQFWGSSVLAAGTNVILCLALIPSYGSIGAAIGVVTSAAVGNLINVYLVWQRLGIMTMSLPLVPRFASSDQK